MMSSIQQSTGNSHFPHPHSAGGEENEVFGNNSGLSRTQLKHDFEWLYYFDGIWIYSMKNIGCTTEPVLSFAW